MKIIRFTKMVGAGNDFVVIDAIERMDYRKLALHVCDRRNGIGADGILILDKSKKCDYRMRIFNADGSEAEMCGNGARCMAAYITRTHRPKKKLFSMETLAGEILASSRGQIANVRLSNPRVYQADIPLNLSGKNIQVSFIDTGVPHAIVFVDGLKNIDVSCIGKAIRYHDQFKPRGTNVNFVEQINSNLIHVRTYERGVEDETKACGTGSVASGIIAYLKSNPIIQNKKNAKMNVHTNGGEILEITFDIRRKEVSNVWLKGSANFIAKGEYYV